MLKMSEFQFIKYEVDGGIATITLNRPQVLNALNDDTLLEIREAMSLAGKDQNIRVVIFTGAGEKAFAAGADIEGFVTADMEEGRYHGKLFQDTVNDIDNSSKVTVAAVNGYALGGGMEVCLGCDVIFASNRAKFGLPEITLGIIPGGGGTQRLPRVVGKYKAKELILTGDFIDAEEAWRLGIVNKVVEPEELMNTAIEFAQKIVKLGPIAVRAGKTAISRGSEVDLNTGLAIELEAFSLLFGTEDMHEGTKAFVEKRKPEFKGK